VSGQYGQQRASFKFKLPESNLVERCQALRRQNLCWFTLGNQLSLIHQPDPIRLLQAVDAQAKEFSKTALIQIAGRAGRGQESYDDEVHFYYQYYNQQIRQACSEIRYLNQQAKR